MTTYRCECFICEEMCKEPALYGIALCGHCRKETVVWRIDVEKRST